MHKTEQLQIRLSASQKNRIRRAAARDGLDMSEWVLSRLLGGRGDAFDSLLEQLRDSDESSYIFSELIEYLGAQTRDSFDDAVAAPPAGLSAYHANYVAALVELAAHRIGVQAPGWTADIAPLAEPVFGTDLTSLRLHLLTKSPPPFRRRNIFIDAAVGDKV